MTIFITLEGPEKEKLGNKNYPTVPRIGESIWFNYRSYEVVKVEHWLDNNSASLVVKFTPIGS